MVPFLGIPRRFKSLLGSGFDTSPRVTSVSPNADRATGGASVTITGVNFSFGSITTPTVTFGSTPATGVVVVSDTRITCTVPAHAASLVDLTVRNQYGQTGTLRNAFTFYQTLIRDISPDHATVAGGTAVVITGANFQAGATITFGGVAATAVNFIDSQHYSCVTPAHAVGPVDVVVNDATSRGGFFFTLLTRGADLRRNPSLVIHEISNGPANCTFTVDGQSSPPKCGEEIVFYEDDLVTIQFAGVVQTVEQAYEELTDQLVWHVTASDYTPWFNRRRPVGDFVNVSATDVIKTLIARFAPWVSTNHVQTGLCAITISFDGVDDFATCMSSICKALGGGHWRLDYQKDMHAFRLVNVQRPGTTLPSTVIGSGPGTALTVTAGASIPSATFSPGYYAFRTSLLYDNGVETAPGPYSNMILLDGVHWPLFSSIPTGAPIGSATCTGRRIFYSFFGLVSGATLDPWQIIHDNVTVTLQSTNTRTNVAGTPRIPLVAPPVGPNSVSVSQSSTAARDTIGAIFPDYYGPGGSRAYFSFTAGDYAAKITNVFDDGTESQSSDASNVVTLDGNHAMAISMPRGEDVGAASVIFRKVYVSRAPTTGGVPPFGSGTTQLWAVIPNNTQAVYNVVPSIVQGNVNNQTPPSIGSGGVQADCVPGPSLEDVDNPADINDSSTTLLRVPNQLVSSVDITQIRNRVTVIGQGATIPPPVILPTAPAAPTTTGADPYAKPLCVAALASSDLQGPPGGFPLNAYWYSVMQSHGHQTGGDAMFTDTNVPPRWTGYMTVEFGLTIDYVNAHPFTVFMTNPGAAQADNSTFVQTPVVQPITNGDASAPSPTVIRPRYTVDDLDSQRFMGAIELDDDGKPTDGIHEIVIDGSSFATAEECIARANAELDLFAWPIVKVVYCTTDPTHPGSQVTIDLSSPPISGTFLVQDVQIDQIHSDTDVFGPVYTVTASSVRFDLDDLLLLIGQTTPTSAPLQQLAAPLAQATSYTNAAVATAVANIPSSGLNSVVVDLTAAQFAALSVTPIVMVAGVAGQVVVPVSLTFEQATYGDVFSGTPSPYVAHSGIGVGGSFFGTLPYSNGFNRYLWNVLTLSGSNDGAFVQPGGRDLILTATTAVTFAGTAPLPRFRLTLTYRMATQLVYP